MQKPEVIETKHLKCCVLVLGADRSSNRALARLLETLGCALPSSQAEGPQGEASKIESLNAELLEWAGSAPDDFTPFRDEWRQSPGADEFLDRAQEVLSEEFGHSSLFVMDEESLARLLPFWMEALRSFGADVRPILMIRNPIEAGEALHRERAYTEPLSQMIWLRCVLDAEAATRGTRRYHASFERLLQGWETVVQEAQEALSLPWPKPIEAAEFEAQGLIDGDLHYTKEAQARSLTSNLLPAWTRETYMILNGWAMSEEMPAKDAMLGNIKAVCDPASRAFTRLVRAERYRTPEPVEQTQNVSEDVTEDEDLLSDHQALVADHENLLAEHQGLVVDHQQLVADHEQLEFDHRQLVADHEQLVVDHERNVLANQELAVECERLNLLAVAASDQIMALKTTLQEERRAATLMNAELHQLKVSRQDLEAELREAQAESAASRARRKEMARVIDNRNAELRTRYQELAALQKRMLWLSPSWGLKAAGKKIWRWYKRALGK